MNDILIPLSEQAQSSIMIHALFAKSTFILHLSIRKEFCT